MRTRPLRTRTILTGAVALGALLAAGLPAVAQPSALHADDRDSAAWGPAAGMRFLDPSHLEALPAGAGGGAGTEVSLPTGDRVTVTVDANGNPAVGGVVTAQRPSGQQVVMHRLARGEDVYVVPSDAVSLLAADVLDWDLFNVAELAELTEHGYTGEVPVIVTYQERARVRRPRAAAGMTATGTGRLSSIDGIAATIDAERNAKPQGCRAAAAGPEPATPCVSTWWQRIQTSNSAKGNLAQATGVGPLAGVEKVWLDGLVEVSLDESVPLIGAPQAWGVGYDGSGATVAVLDTGIDETHPDVQGRIVASKSFIEGEEVQDGHGHGTHVASTVVGSGAASGGQYTGVAPGADLVVGKVLDDGGSGPTSGVIEGMEWAVQEAGADIVSMSLGGNPTDGTDPMSQSVNQLSASTDALFVISAGNDGPASETIGTPGAADAALTVAATDKQDQLADFSSRGPRLGDGAAKPDIAAPGVAIVAARSATGSDMEGLAQPVGQHYLRASGTSMAAPHVSGAAAILAQQHPDLTGQQLKAVLMGSAVDVGYGIYEQGAGRLDVAGAVNAAVYADGSVTFGRLPYPHTDPVHRSLTYTNLTDEPVTLSLDSNLTTHDGQAAPEGTLRLGQDELTVPAHGTADVTVALDASRVDSGPYGPYKGVVTAVDPTGTIHPMSRVSAYVEPEMFDVDIELTAPDDATEVAFGGWLVVRMDGQQEHLVEGRPLALPAGPHATTRLPAGQYFVSAGTSWWDDLGRVHHALPAAPEVKVAKSTTVHLDLNQAARLAVQTPRPTERYETKLAYQRVGAPGPSTPGWQVTTTGVVGYGHWTGRPWSGDFWLLPSGQVTHGSSRLISMHNLGVPFVRSMHALGGGPVMELTPGDYWSTAPDYPKLDGHGIRRLVYAGQGRHPEDYEAIDAAGAIVLVTPDCGHDPLGCGEEIEAAATDAGAAAVLVHASGNDPQLVVWLVGSSRPTMWLPRAEADALVERLKRRSVRIRYQAQAETPYVYALRFAEDNHIPDDLTYRVRHQDLYQIDRRMHAGRESLNRYIRSTWNAFQVGDPLIYGLSCVPFLGCFPVEAPMDYVTHSRASTVTEYIGPADPDVLWKRTVRDAFTDGPSTSRTVGRFISFDVFDEPGRRTEKWRAAPSVPGASVLSPKVREILAEMVLEIPAASPVRECLTCRTGNLLVPVPSGPGSDNEPSHWGNFRWLRLISPLDPDDRSTEVRLFKDGEQIPMTRAFMAPPVSTFELPLPFPVPAFTLPSDPGTYTLVENFHDDRRTDQRYATETSTRWTFHSQRPTGQPPTGHTCGGHSTWLDEDGDGEFDPPDPNTPCRAEPLLFLRYDLGLDLDNTRPAGRRHTISVTGYHSDFVSPEPSVTELGLEVSFDDGETWTPVDTRPTGDNTFTASYHTPRLDDTTGAVSLRVQAEDADGNTVDQTIKRAYGLK